jgi:hypothetical protein
MEYFDDNFGFSASLFRGLAFPRVVSHLHLNASESTGYYVKLQGIWQEQERHSKSFEQCFRSVSHVREHT